MGKKGIILVISIAVMAILLLLTGSFFFGLISESGFVRREKFGVQALGLAEAGANRGRAELNSLLSQNLTQVRVTTDQAFKSYCAGNNSTGMLSYYLGFNCSGGECTHDYTINDLSEDFDTTAVGSYGARIIVTQNGNPENLTGSRYVFRYNYSIEGWGNISNTGDLSDITSRNKTTAKTILMSGGSFNATVYRENLAKFALFTNRHTTPSGDVVWFTSNTTFTGPVFTNSNFSFAQNASFTSEVAQNQTRARFYNNGRPVLKDSDSNSPYDVPDFDEGFERGQAAINLTSSVSQSDLRDEVLGTMSEPAKNGTYVANDGTSVTGGIYIKGNSAVNATTGAANSTAVYTVTQGTNTTVITVDYANNQTTVTTSNGTQVYSGIPDGEDNEGVVIYDNGTITGLSGTIQEDSQVTIASKGDIVISDSIYYEEYDTSPTLNADAYTNVLGIISWEGNVRIGTSAPNDIVICAVVMAPNGVFTVDNYNSGSSRGIATLLGGMITNYYGAFGTFSGSRAVSGYGRNFIYDSRMLNGTTPPYFPYLTGFAVSISGLGNKLPFWQEEGQ